MSCPVTLPKQITIQMDAGSSNKPGVVIHPVDMNAKIHFDSFLDFFHAGLALGLQSPVEGTFHHDRPNRINLSNKNKETYTARFRRLVIAFLDVPDDFSMWVSPNIRCAFF